jgi:hypothetical protein
MMLALRGIDANGLVEIPPKRDNIGCNRGGCSCPTESIANTDIRIAARSEKSSQESDQSRKRRLALERCKCRERMRFRVAHNAAPSCHQFLNRLVNARSAASSCIPAANALISILRVGLSVRSLSPSGLRGKTSAINARFIPCGCGSKRKLLPRARLGLWMREQHSRISSRNSHFRGN